MDFLRGSEAHLGEKRNALFGFLSAPVLLPNHPVLYGNMLISNAYLLEGKTTYQTTYQQKTSQALTR